MIESLPDDKFDELFKKLPGPLQDAIFAPETGEKIQGICDRNKTPELMDFMINGIGDIYLGVLPPDDFFAALEKQMEGKSGVKQVILEINNFLLFPYKDPIEKIYHLQCAPAPTPDKLAAAPADNAQPAEPANAGQAPPQTAAS